MSFWKMLTSTRLFASANSHTLGTTLRQIRMLFSTPLSSPLPVAPDDAAHNQADLDVAVPHSNPENLAELAPVADGRLDDSWSWVVSKKDKKKGKKVRAYPFDEAAESFKDAGPESKTVRSKRLELWDDFGGKSYAISAPSFQPRRNWDFCLYPRPV